MFWCEQVGLGLMAAGAGLWWLCPNPRPTVVGLLLAVGGALTLPAAVEGLRAAWRARRGRRDQGS
jgi:hypothetical protein